MQKFWSKFKQENGKLGNQVWFVRFYNGVVWRQDYYDLANHRRVMRRMALKMKIEDALYWKTHQDFSSLDQNSHTKKGSFYNERPAKSQ